MASINKRGKKWRAEVYIGHRDIGSLMFYYNTTADELADRLG